MRPDQKTIIRGSDSTLTLVIRTGSGDPFDIFEATDIVVKFRKADKTALTISGDAVRVVNAALGRIEIELTDADTEVLMPMTNAPVEVIVDFADKRKTAQIKHGLNIVDRIFL